MDFQAHFKKRYYSDILQKNIKVFLKEITNEAVRRKKVSSKTMKWINLTSFVDLSLYLENVVNISPTEEEIKIITTSLLNNNDNFGIIIEDHDFSTSFFYIFEPFRQIYFERHLPVIKINFRYPEKYENAYYEIVLWMGKGPGFNFTAYRLMTTMKWYDYIDNQILECYVWDDNSVELKNKTFSQFRVYPQINKIVKIPDDCAVIHRRNAGMLKLCLDGSPMAHSTDHYRFHTDES